MTLEVPNVAALAQTGDYDLVLRALTEPTRQHWHNEQTSLCFDASGWICDPDTGQWPRHSNGQDMTGVEAASYLLAACRWRSLDQVAEAARHGTHMGEPTELAASVRGLVLAAVDPSGRTEEDLLTALELYWAQQRWVCQRLVEEWRR